MRVAIVNNGASVPQRIMSLVGEHETQIFSYEEACSVLAGAFDLVILSGSSQFPIAYNLEKLANELSLIRESSTPILGICYGCELIAVAFGGTLKDIGERRRDVLTIRSVTDDALFEDMKEFPVYDAHRWVIDTLPEELEVLAESEHGPEIIRHRTRPIYGFQFHPEKMLDETQGDELFASLLKKDFHI